GQAAAEQLPQALRNVQDLARRRPGACADELTPQLEREERVSRRRFLDSHELRPGQVEPEPLDEQYVERTEAERSEPEPFALTGGEGVLEREGRRILGDADSCQQANRLDVQPAQRDLERAARSRVEPLSIVDGDQNRPLPCESAERVEHGQADRV